jgi:hypothetical protein
MKNYFKYILLIGIMASSSTADAQWLKKLGDRLLKKAEKKTEQKLEKMGDKTTDKVLDSVFKEDKNKKNNQKKSNNSSDSSSETGMPDMGGLGDMMEMMTKEVKIADSYTFHTTISMERSGAGVTATDNTMVQRLGDTATLTEIPQTKMIIDTVANAMITLLEDTKEAQVMNMGMIDGFMNMGDQEEEPEIEEPVISSNGTTKTISGYTCQHKSITTSTQQIDLWYTDEVTVDMSAYMNMLRVLPQAAQNSPSEIVNQIDGFVIQMDVLDKVNNTSFGTKVTEISFEDTQVNMSDYTILKF